ncbi:piezo-type mechanosensitive ion channel component [Ditylenchus destructor]|nr:piezo-type mechanosensitive ion channel component [Ditylenchus destructor]
MVAELAKRFCYRVVLPACLFTGAFLRPSFISLIYVLVALIGPAFPSIRKNVPIAVFTIAESEYEHECLDAVSYPVRFWLRQAGFIRIPQNITFSTIRLITPELLSLLGSLVALIVCTAFQTDSGTESNWRQPQQTDDLNEGLQVNEQAPSTSSATATCPIRLQHPSALKFSTAIVPSLKRVSDVLLMLFVVAIGAIQPSILNSAYFAIFLVVLTWWALYTPLRRNTFNMIKRIFILYSALHFITIYVYQIQVVQDVIPPKSFPARLVGLTALVSTKCTNQTLWWELQWPDYYSWTGYVNFGFLLLLYHVLVLQYVWTRNGVKGFGRSSVEGGMGGPNDDNGSSVHEELYALDDIRPAVPNPLEATVGFLDIEKDIDGKVLLSNSSSEEADMLNAPEQRITSEILDRQKISMIVNGPGEKTSMAAQGMQAFLYFCLYHCYVFGLLAMMTWALLYHSVFGLIFLISACFLWALRNSRKWSFALSPVILLYTEFLLVAQYIYSMDIAGELPHESFMEIIGFIFAASKTQSFVTLCVKVLLSLPIFLLLRLHLRENYYNSLTDHDRLKRLTYGTFDAITSTTYPSGRNVVQTRRSQPPRSVTHPDNAAFDFITHYFVKYWIFVVVTLLLINCPLTESRQPVLYNLGFFAFFTILIVNLHISFNFFRRTIYLFLTVLIIYTSLVLIAVYSYQFPSVDKIFQKFTGLNKNWTDDIGLVVFDNAQHDVTLLFIRLILPISLIVVTMLQLKFFHDPWTKLVKIPSAARSAPPVTPATAEAGTSAQLNTLDDTIVLAKGHMRELIEVLWRLAEVHGYRFILFIMVMVAVEHFCVLNFVIIVFVSLAACLTSLTGTISLLMCVYMSTTFIARRVYELHLSQNFDAVVVESNDTGAINDCSNGTIPCHQFKSVTTWLGFSDAADLRSDLQGLVLVIVLIGLQLCVRYRQKHRRAMLGIPEPQPGIIFPDVGPSMFDRNIVSSLKCLLNYGFYKFGLEISLAAMVVVAWIRMDMGAALLTIWLLFFVFMPRAGCRVCWPIFLIYLAVMFPLQYAMAIGLPEDWNLDYPWNGLLKQKRLDNNLSYFLDLANNRMPAFRFRGYIVADFFLLAIAAAQGVVFSSESINHPAGDNSSIYKDKEYTLFKNNPRYDFVIEQRSFVDFFKLVVFMYGHWITVIMIMAAGLGGTSLFALGYLILAFWMLWQGNNLYTMNNYGRTIYW